MCFLRPRSRKDRNEARSICEMKPVATRPPRGVSSELTRVGLRARNPRLCRLPRFSPSGIVAAHSVTYRGGSAPASHRLPCSADWISLRRPISNGFDEAAFDPRKNGDGSLGSGKVKLPGVTIADPSLYTAPGQRIAHEIIAANVDQVVYAESEAEPPVENDAPRPAASTVRAVISMRFTGSSYALPT